MVGQWLALLTCTVGILILNLIEVNILHAVRMFSTCLPGFSPTRQNILQGKSGNWMETNVNDVNLYNTAD